MYIHKHKEGEGNAPPKGGENRAGRLYLWRISESLRVVFRWFGPLGIFPPQPLASTFRFYVFKSASRLNHPFKSIIRNGNHNKKCILKLIYKYLQQLDREEFPDAFVQIRLTLNFGFFSMRNDEWRVEMKNQWEMLLALLMPKVREITQVEVAWPMPIHQQ